MALNIPVTLQEGVALEGGEEANKSIEELWEIIRFVYILLLFFITDLSSIRVGIEEKCFKFFFMAFQRSVSVEKNMKLTANPPLP